MARSKFTLAIRQTIIDALKAGNFLSVACDLAGIWPQTYHDWIARGETEADDESSEYARFARDCALAKAEVESDAVKSIIKAGADSWQATAWFLERSRPDRWAKQDWRKPNDDSPQDFVVELGPPPAPEPSPDDDPTGEFPALSPDPI